MDLHDRAVDRDAQWPVRFTLIELRLQFDPLQLGEDTLQDALSIRSCRRMDTVCQGPKRPDKTRQLQPSPAADPSCNSDTSPD